MLGNLDIQNIHEASNGERAINLAEQYSPGLVLLDINLPDCDGIDLLDKLRTIVPESKILMVSSEATVDHIKAAQAKGSIGFIVKPFNAEVVLQKITSALKEN